MLARRSQKWLVVAALLAPILFLIGWAAAPSRTPRYLGKPPSYWIKFDYRGPQAEQQFRVVWRGLGSNAVPFLTKALHQTNPPRPRFDYRVIWRSLPTPARNWLPIPSPPANVVRSRAASALGIIGPDSKAAIPQLIILLQQDESIFVRSAAEEALHQIDASVNTGFLKPKAN